MRPLYKLSLNGVQRPVINLDNGRMERVTLPQGTFAIDFEAIDALADGRVVALSERLRSLVSKDGVIVEYDDPFAEIGERGLEGLAVRRIDDKTPSGCALGGRIPRV